MEGPRELTLVPSWYHVQQVLALSTFPALVWSTVKDAHEIRAAEQYLVSRGSVVIRLTNVYGGIDDGSFVGQARRVAGLKGEDDYLAIEGRPYPTPDGTPMRNWLHHLDVEECRKRAPLRGPLCRVRPGRTG